LCSARLMSRSGEYRDTLRRSREGRGSHLRFLSLLLVLLLTLSLGRAARALARSLLAEGLASLPADATEASFAAEVRVRGRPRPRGAP
jgi:hypothetical protein